MRLPLTVCLLMVCSLSATVDYSDIPKLTPLYPNVSSSSSYSMNTFIPLALTAQSYFILNFSSSNIVAPNSSINCSYLNQTTQSYTSFTSTWLLI